MFKKRRIIQRRLSKLQTREMMETKLRAKTIPSKKLYKRLFDWKKDDC